MAIGGAFWAGANSPNWATGLSQGIGAGANLAYNRRQMLTLDQMSQLNELRIKQEESALKFNQWLDQKIYEYQRDIAGIIAKVKKMFPEETPPNFVTALPPEFVGPPVPEALSPGPGPIANRVKGLFPAIKQGVGGGLASAAGPIGKAIQFAGYNIEPLLYGGALEEPSYAPGNTGIPSNTNPIWGEGETELTALRNVLTDKEASMLDEMILESGINRLLGHRGRRFGFEDFSSSPIGVEAVKAALLERALSR